MQFQIFELQSHKGQISLELVETGNLAGVEDWKDFKTRVQNRLNELRRSKVLGQAIVTATKPYPDGAIVGVEILDNGIPGELSLITRDEFDATWMG